MITNISYNVIIERFRAFAEGHFLIKGFTHGDPSNVDLLKGVEFPWMHVFPVEVAPQNGSRLYSFIITFADLPRDKETPPEYQREMLSDCIRLAEDLLAEIKNGLTLFGPTVELDGASSIECFINEFSHTLTGVNLSLTLSVPWDWNACDVPGEWAVGGSGSGGAGGGGLGVILETNGVLNGEQGLLNLQQGANVTIVDNGLGTVTISAGSAAINWGDILGNLSDQTDLQNALNAKANNVDLGAVAFSNDYNDLDNLPTIPAAQVNSDWNSVSGLSEILNKPTLATVATSGDYNDLSNLPTIPAAQVPSDWAATSGVTRILNKPTIPAAQVNSDWNSSSGVSQILNKPTIPAAQVNSDWNASSGVAQILNKPTIPAAQIQSDWNQTNNAALDFIKNKPTIGSGSVTSVGVSVPAPVNPALSVSGSPVTTSGTITISANGTSSQLIDGTGALQTIPTGLPPTGSAGGDLSGTYPNPNVDRVHGVDFQSGTPSVGEVWLYEGSPAKWQHQQLPAIHVGNDSAVTGSTVKDALNHLNTTKVESNAAITGATATKITYDSKGLVTAGTTLAASDIPSGIDAANIGTGVVSNTEFAYLDGVTSAIQTQIDGKQSTLVSGTSIKTIEGQSLLGAGNIDLTKSDVGLANVDNTSDANKPISTATQTALNSKVDTTRTISTSSPLSGGGDLSANRTLSIADAVADGATKGAAAFTASDFNSASGVISLDYANGQKASAAQPGFLSAADWSTFNSKPAVSTMVFAAQITVTQAANSTAYWPITGANIPNATETLRVVPMPVAGTIKNLYIRIGAAQSATGSLVFTMRKNSVSQAVTITFTNTDGANVTKSDTTNSFSVAAGDLITIQGVNNAPSSASATVISITFILERS